MKKNAITIEATVKSNIETVWDYWNSPEHITKWAFASDDWEAPEAQNDLRAGGRFVTVMSAKDKSSSFDFAGTYTDIVEYEKIAYRMDDDRIVITTFSQTPDGIHIEQTFDPENQNPIDMQRAGWQAILDNFKHYAETTSA